MINTHKNQCIVLTQTPVQEVETTYGLYTIEDLTSADALKDDDLLIVNSLRTDNSTYVTGRTTIKELVDYVGSTLSLGGISPANVYTKDDITAALNNSDSFDSFKEYLMNM